MTPRPSDSAEQRTAEAEILDGLAGELEVSLDKRRFGLGEGVWCEVDAVSEDLSVICEIRAHQGPPKSAQKNKVMTDALKLVMVRDRFGTPKSRLISAFADEEAAQFFRGDRWMAEAFRHFGVEVRVIPLSKQTRDSVIQAQQRQYR